MASKSHDVAIKVVSQKGTCSRKHFVGEEWLITGKSPGGICMSALAAMMPYISVMRYSSDGFP